MGAKKKSAALNPDIVAKNLYEKYDVIEVNRQELKNAPYNPRIISEKAKKALRRNLEKVGLVSPITWNKRTGNIVAGHQRIAALDSLMKTYNYNVKVAVVDLDEASEKEQNIFMNNPEAHGDFDIERLEELVKDNTLNSENMGFDAADIYKVFGTMSPNVAEEELTEMGNKLRKIQDTFQQILDKTEEDNDLDFYMVVVFKDWEARKEFTDRLGLEDNRYVDGRTLMDLVAGADSDGEEAVVNEESTDQKKAPELSPQG
jgi:hypothetical protein